MASNEKTRSVRLPNVVEALIPIVVMMGLMIYGLNFTDETYVDAHMPLAVSIVVACIVGGICGHSFSDMLAGMIDRLNATMEAILILCAVGLLVASFLMSGTIPALIYYGLNLLTPQLFLPVGCFLCAIVGLACGSSWTATATMGIAMLGIGAGLGIPYDVLVKEYNSSYSAARAALLDAWEEFRMRRTWFVDDFCQPVYEIWLSEAVARGRSIAPGFFDDPLIRAAWCSAQWIGPVQGSLDPLKEANAAVLKIQHGLKTHEQATMEDSGGDWNANVEQLKAENEKLKAAGGGASGPLPDVPTEKDDDEGGDSE